MSRFPISSTIPNSDDSIYFYAQGTNKQYYSFSSYSDSLFFLDGKYWKTAAHYYHSRRVLDGETQDTIRNIESPWDAREHAKSYLQRTDWDNIKFQSMYDATYAKFYQRPDCRGLLLSTKNSIIKEDSPYDNYWGSRNGGFNKMGMVLMSVRETLRKDFELK